MTFPYYHKTFPPTHDTNTVIGIPEIEELAQGLRTQIIQENLHTIPRSPLDPIFTADETIELITREMVQGYKAAGVGPKLLESDDLEKVLFDVVYPLFGSRQKPTVGEAEGKVQSNKGVSGSKGTERGERAAGNKGATERVEGNKGAKSTERAEGNEAIESSIWAKGNGGVESSEGAEGNEEAERGEGPSRCVAQ